MLLYAAQTRIPPLKAPNSKRVDFPLRGLIFYHAAVRSFFSRRRPVLQNVHPRLHGVHFLHLVQKGSHNYARVSSQLTDSQWQRS